MHSTNKMARITSKAIQTSPMDCSNDSWRVIFSANQERSALWLLTCGTLEKLLLTYTAILLHAFHLRVSGMRVYLFRYVASHSRPAQPSIPPGSVKSWVPASAGRAKADMVHSVSGWTQGMQVKLCVIPWERMPYLSALEVHSRWGAIQIHVYLT